METREELMQLTKVQLQNRLGLSQHDKRNKAVLVDLLLNPETSEELTPPPASEGETGVLEEASETSPTEEADATSETLSPEERNALYANQIPLLAGLVAEQVMPRLPAPTRSTYETWQVMAVLFRWYSMCGEKHHECPTVYAAIIRPASQIGRNLRMHLRRAITQEFGASTDAHYRGNLLTAMLNGMSATFPAGEVVEVGRERLKGLLDELETATA